MRVASGGEAAGNRGGDPGPRSHGRGPQLRAAYVNLNAGWGGFRQVSDARAVESPWFLERATGIEPTSRASETIRPDSVAPWPTFHAAKASAREYRNGRVKIAVSVHCSPPQPFLSPVSGSFYATSAGRIAGVTEKAVQTSGRHNPE
jgi:hypothetical protein